MKPLSEDDLLTKALAELPAVPLDPGAADAVRRAARAALVNVAHVLPPAAPPLVRLTRAWTDTVLPGLLLASGAAYTWGAVQMLARIYVG